MRPQVKEAEAIFDEVDETDYRTIVKGRLAEDDFIEEEGGVSSGYADNGMDDWDQNSEEDEEAGKSGTHLTLASHS